MYLLYVFQEKLKIIKNYCDIVKPDAINIDYNVDPKEILKILKYLFKEELDPKILLTDKETLKKEN